MNTYHISIARASLTALEAIIAGEQPAIAVKTCFTMRKVVNELYNMGLSPDEIAEAIEKHPA